MFQIGQDVVLMSMAGRFRIVAVDGAILTLENDAGVRKRVADCAVRVLDRPEKTPDG